MARKPAKKSSGAFTTEQLRFFAAMREVFPYQQLVEAARMAGLTYDKVGRWRERNPRFKIAMDALKGELTALAKAKKLDAKTLAAGKEPPPLAAPLKIFVVKWRATVNRVESARAAGMTLKEVERAREENPDFDRACQEIEEEFRAAVEDAQLRNAIATGATAANAVLKARSGGRGARAGAQPQDRRARVEALRRVKSREIN